MNNEQMTTLSLQTSWQRSREAGDDDGLKIPLTCCTLEDDDDTDHMNPRPVDTDLCQDTNLIPNKWRHGPGCLGFILDLVTGELVIIVGLSLGSSVVIMVILAAMILGVN